MKQRNAQTCLGAFIVFAIIAGALIAFAAPAHAQAAVQQTVITWDAYVDPAPVPPATVTPISQVLARYQINWGQGAACNLLAAQLVTVLVTIPKATAPLVTPTIYTHTGYPDSNALFCYEVFVGFADGSWSPRSKRLYKEIISTKPPVANPVVQ